MRVSVNNKGRVGVSFSTRRGGKDSGGCLGVIFIIVIFFFLISKCTGPSDDDLKAERVKANDYQDALTSREEIYNNICESNVTTDGAESFFNENLKNKWLTINAIVEDEKDSILTASSKFPENNKPNADIKIIQIQSTMEDKKIIKKGDSITIKFVPTGYSISDCSLAGVYGSY